MAEESLAEDETEFWEQRHTLTPQATTAADVQKRAENGSRHLVLLTDITDKTVLSQFESELADFGQFECIASVPLQYIHVTVKVVGNVVENIENEANLTADQEERIVEAVRSTPPSDFLDSRQSRRSTSNS